MTYITQIDTDAGTTTGALAAHHDIGAIGAGWPSTNVTLSGTSSGWRSCVVEIVGI
jgi:hypothetical protein